MQKDMEMMRSKAAETAMLALAIRHGDHDRYHAPGSVFAGHAGGKAQTCEKMLKTGMAYAIISKVAVIYA